MEVVFKALISLAIAGAGVYVLAHVTAGAHWLQDLYVRNTIRIQGKKDFRSHLFIYNPETWRTPFATFLFKAMVGFFGIWLLIVAYPIVFGPITFGSYDISPPDVSVISTLQEYDAYLYATCSQIKQKSESQLKTAINQCNDNATCIENTKKQYAASISDESLAICAYTMILNDEMGTGTMKMLAEQEQMAVDSQRALGMSNDELRSRLTTGLNTLLKGYDTELGLQMQAFLTEYVSHRHFDDPTINDLANSMLQKWGSCWGIPSGQCKE